MSTEHWVCMHVRAHNYCASFLICWFISVFGDAILSMWLFVSLYVFLTISLCQTLSHRSPSYLASYHLTLIFRLWPLYVSEDWDAGHCGNSNLRNVTNPQFLLQTFPTVFRLVVGQPACTTQERVFLPQLLKAIEIISIVWVFMLVFVCVWDRLGPAGSPGVLLHR